MRVAGGTRGTTNDRIRRVIITGDGSRRGCRVAATHTTRGVRAPNGTCVRCCVRVVLRRPARGTRICLRQFPSLARSLCAMGHHEPQQLSGRGIDSNLFGLGDTIR